MDRVAFSDASHGDMRDGAHRAAFAHSRGIPPGWGLVDQVHGASVAVVDGPGLHGQADAVVTTTPTLPIAVFTADCLGVALVGDGVVGVAHAGWRGLAAGVLESTIDVMTTRANAPTRAAIGPAIGPCCYEVGPEVVDAVGHRAETTWGTESVDLVAAATDRLVTAGVEVVIDGRCTRCGDGLHSHRRDATTHRQATITWR